MARRKQEIALQMQIETQEEWEELLAKEGLNVVDVFQEWCGPCTGMIANLRRLKNELGDDLLRFATAKADTIDSLDKYRGHCEPCFLFYAGGSLVAVVRGANSPKILRTITEQLTQEHKVLDGNAERKEIKDPFIAQMESKEKETEKEEEEEEEGKAKGKPTMKDGTKPKSEAVKEVTVALIKPDAVQAGKVEQIIADIKAAGIEVLRHEERKLTEDEARQFYSHLQDQDFFDELVKFMCSGPSHVLALTKGKTGENVISEFRDLIGPTDVEEAKTQAPESLRAKHGQQTFMNALHGSSSTEMATRELAFFFPDFVAPSIEAKGKIQRTLALVRPEAFRLHKDDILSKIRESGFKVAMQKEMHLTREMAEDFYKEHKGQDYFDQLVTNMSSGPVLAMGLARDDAIQGWRSMLGPKEVPQAKEEAPESLRAKFAVDDAINSLHGSDSEAAAKKELEFFFPMEQTVAVIKPDAGATKDEIIDRIHEAGFRIAARKETTLTKEIAEEFYSDHKDKDYYNDLVEHMTSGPTYLMVLSREGAVDGWRSMIGPTDPSKAKEEAPDSLRATYGETILKNAVHGSSTKDHALQTIKTLFGDLKFNKDGSQIEEVDEGEQKQGVPLDEPYVDKTESAESAGSKDAEEPAPEFRESQDSEQKTEEKSPTEDQNTEQSMEQTNETENQKDEQSVEQTDSNKEQTSPEQTISSTEEQKEEAKKEEEKAPTPKPSETEAKEEKAPSPKPSETEAKEEKAPSPKPSETEAKEEKAPSPKPSETEAKEEKAPSPKPSETEAKTEGEKTEEKQGEETEKKAEESTTQESEGEKKEEEKAPETPSEEKKD